MKQVRFGDLPVGAEFWEIEDEYGGRWVFPLVKITPKAVGPDEDIMTARAGKVLFAFQDEEMVEVKE